MKISRASLVWNLELIAVAAAIGCAPGRAPVIVPPIVRTVPGTDTIPIALPELGSRTYHAIAGGLFPGGSNVPSGAYAALGIAHRNLILPLTVNGIPSGAGRYVLLSVGSSDESAAWCSASSAPPCDSWSFTGKAVSDPNVNHTALVIVNGAMPGAGIDRWSNRSDSNYIRIRDTRLAPLGLSENQVQAIWMHLSDSATNLPLTASRLDANAQIERMGAVLRALRSRYSNLRQVFISSAADASGETAAYESGFVVKWIVESQIDALALPGGAADPATVPWLSWGPYLWVRGDQPSAAKTGAMLFGFFSTSPNTRCWFLTVSSCG